ncbi:MAG: 2-phospho-L-lactate transferase [Anaerolineales bacterium]|nr:2-phospho-L-lactate transferase [Anaerolineales bacterium]
MKIVALAGGVGGARLSQGLAQILPPGDLTIIVNVGDDFEHLGLKICPDLDTVCYTLAGMANPMTGWGRADESWGALESLAALGGPSWFRLGDRDLGLHLERTRRLRRGQRLSQMTQKFCQAWGVRHTILPVTDDEVPTRVRIAEEDTGREVEIAFQDYFVRWQCLPSVCGFRFAGVEAARPAPGVLEALDAADAVILCPSNPWVSIDPILAVPGVQASVQARLTVAISPIIGGQTVKGPAAKMYKELGYEPSALAVARHYRSILTGFVVDAVDAEMTEMVGEMGIRTLVTDTMMRTSEDRRRLAGDVLAFLEEM